MPPSKVSTPQFFGDAMRELQISCSCPRTIVIVTHERNLDAGADMHFQIRKDTRESILTNLIPAVRVVNINGPVHAVETSNKDAASSLRERLRATVPGGMAEAIVTPPNDNVAGQCKSEKGQTADQHHGIGVLARKRPLEGEADDQQGPNKLSCSVETDDAIAPSGDVSAGGQDSAMQMWDDLGAGADTKSSAAAPGEDSAVDTEVLSHLISFPHRASTWVCSKHVCAHAQP